MTGTGSAAAGRFAGSTGSHSPHVLPAFGSDSSFILERIKRSRATLKIILKTKDDPFFLGDWITHHGAMVGPENLIVLDNGSTDRGVLATYAALHERVPIFRFEGYYNDVHFPERFADLYAALRTACASFLFLDTDEFLTYYDGERILSDDRSLARLRSGIHGDFIPTTRLNGVEVYVDRFVCGTDREVMRQNLKWGKPIMRAASVGWPELINHNVHLRGVLKPDARAGYFILHRALLSPEQRIRNDVNKLIARGFMKPDEALEDMLGRDVPEDEYMIGIYRDEIRRLLALRGQRAPADARLAPGTMRITDDGRLDFASTVEERVFFDYLENFANIVREVVMEGRGPIA